MVPITDANFSDYAGLRGGDDSMTLILLQVMGQSISSTLQWMGFYTGIRTLPDDKPRHWRWIVGSAAVFTAWLIGVVLLASDNFFRNDVLPPMGAATRLARADSSSHQGGGLLPGCSDTWAAARSSTWPPPASLGSRLPFSIATAV
jgi:hypothetical protein